MALTTVISAMEGAVTVALDVSTADAVTALAVTNGSQQPVTVDVTRPNGNVVSRAVAAGTTASVSIAKGKQFSYSAAAADWTVSLSVG